MKMLITLRNSGAESISVEKILNEDTKFKLLTKNEYDYNEVMNDKKVVLSFVIDTDDVNVILLEKIDTFSTSSYKINIESSDRIYYLNYSEIPGFYKILLNKLYPEIIEEQVEEFI